MCNVHLCVCSGTTKKKGGSKRRKASGNGKLFLYSFVLATLYIYGQLQCGHKKVERVSFSGCCLIFSLVLLHTRSRKQELSVQDIGRKNNKNYSKTQFRAMILSAWVRRYRCWVNR